MSLSRPSSSACTGGAAPRGLGKGVDRMLIRIVPPTQAPPRVSPWIHS